MVVEVTITFVVVVTITSFWVRGSLVLVVMTSSRLEVVLLLVIQLLVSPRAVSLGRTDLNISDFCLREAISSMNLVILPTSSSNHVIGAVGRIVVEVSNDGNMRT